MKKTPGDVIEYPFTDNEWFTLCDKGYDIVKIPLFWRKDFLYKDSLLDELDGDTFCIWGDLI